MGWNLASKHYYNEHLTRGKEEYFYSLIVVAAVMTAMVKTMMVKAANMGWLPSGCWWVITVLSKW